MTYIKIFLIGIHCIIIAVITTIVSPVDYKGKLVHYISKVFSKVILMISKVKVERIGIEKINPKEKYIFVSNHMSNFDIPILMYAVPNVLRFIYKKSLGRIPVFGWAMYLAKYIPIDRTDARSAITSLKKAAVYIKRGISVSIFPEGTRSRDGKIAEFKKGVFVLAEEAKEKIVPVTIKGSFDIMKKGSKKINPGTVKVIFSEPLEYRKDRNFLKEIREIIIANFNGS